ncbi:MAG: DNA primase [Candidatus Eisenbacteria bacterium]
MARRIPEQLIEDIRSANDIVDVISERIRTKKAGRNYKACCPFHDEKSPSFNINPERQIYHCFGCGVGGNVITFLMEYEKIGFIEAVRELAQRAGISIPERAGEAGSAEDPIYAANAMAVRYFRGCFAGPAGEGARAYWRGRGIGDEITEMFQIGCAKPGWDGLLKTAAKEGVTPQVLEEAGLVIERDKGGHYDRFRDRLVFPLLWTGGRVVGFGGRAMDDSEPKYLNSPETRVYHKGHYLYGLAQARPALRASREAILVEGYMDTLSLYEAGFHNVVASAGTALTPEQARVISRYADRVFVAYDGDTAGIVAATRAAELLVKLGVKVRIAALPDGADPDSLVREEGADALKAQLDGARDFIDFLLATDPPQTAEDREKAARGLLDTVASIEDPIKADLMLEKIAQSLAIDRGALTRALGARRADDSRRAALKSGPGAAPGSSAARAMGAAELAAQKGLVGILLTGGDEARRVNEELTPSDFTDPVLSGLAEQLMRECGETVDVGALLDRLSTPDEAAVITEISVVPSDDDNGGRVCGDYIRVIRRSAIEAEIAAVDREIETAEMTGDEEKLLSRVTARQELARRLSELAGSD